MIKYVCDSCDKDIDGDVFFYAIKYPIAGSKRGVTAYGHWCANCVEEGDNVDKVYAVIEDVDDRFEGAFGKCAKT